MANKLENEPRQWVVYCLIDPRTKEPRYVGWTTDLQQRFRRHLHESFRAHSHVYHWIQELLSQKLIPECDILEEGIGHGWTESEQNWISTLRELGYNLTNHTDGGDGMLGYSPTDETRAKISAYHKAHPPSRYVIEKAREATKGKPKPQHVIDAVVAAHTGTHQSDEQKRKSSVAQKANWASGRYAGHAPNKGKVFSPESRDRMSAGQKKRWALIKQSSGSCE